MEDNDFVDKQVKFMYGEKYYTYLLENQYIYTDVYISLYNKSFINDIIQL